MPKTEPETCAICHTILALGEEDLCEGCSDIEDEDYCYCEDEECGQDCDES